MCHFLNWYSAPTILPIAASILISVQTTDAVQTLKATAIALLVITLATAGYVALLRNGNARIEAKCQASGGQVLVTPGQVSRCLLPVR